MVQSPLLSETMWELSSGMPVAGYTDRCAGPLLAVAQLCVRDDRFNLRSAVHEGQRAFGRCLRSPRWASAKTVTATPGLNASTRRARSS